MMKDSYARRMFVASLLITSLLLTGCGKDIPPLPPEEQGGAAQSSGEAAVSSPETIEQPTEAVRSGASFAADGEIRLSDSGCTLPESGVTQEGNILTITSPGSYLLSGALSDGQLCVDTDGKEGVTLILDGISLTNPTGCALQVKSCDGGVTLSLPEGAVNLLAGKNTAEEDETDTETKAVLFAKSDLLFTGAGTLSVSAKNCRGIFSKDAVRVDGGNLLLSADDDALRGKDSITVNGGSITLAAGGDGLHTSTLLLRDGKISGSTVEDGLDAATLTVEGGEVTLVCGGGSSEMPSGGGFGRDDPGRGGDFGQGGGFDRGGRKPDGRENRPDMPGGKPDDMPNEPFGEKMPGFSDTASDAAESSGGKGLKADESITVTGGTVTLDCADDAVHSNGDFSLTGGSLRLSSSDDGIHADKNLTLDGGSVTITRSKEGIEGQFITLRDGTVMVTASDDGFNAVDNSESESTTENAGGFWGGFGGRGGMGNVSTNCTLTIQGGICTVNAGGDGLDSNGSIYQTGGRVTVFGPTDNGNGAIDYGDGRDCSYEMSGGTLLAVGSAGMAQAPVNKGQPVIAGQLNSVSAGSVITISLAGSDRAIFSTSVPKSFSHIVFSSPDLTAGERYTLTVDGETHATLQAK